MKDKIGLAIITYNRPGILKQCIDNAKNHDFGGAGAIVVCDDGTTGKNYIKYLSELKTEGIKTSVAKKNRGVVFNKNNGLRILMEAGCEHIFLMEDDILITDNEVCNKYIENAKQCNIQHMNFALHGPMNNINRRFFFKRITGELVCVYPDCVGAFSYYTREVIENVGYMDTKFKNAYDHVEHTYRIIKAGYTTPFWFFADHPESFNLLKEIPSAIETSVIRVDKARWEKNMKESQTCFERKHGAWLPQRRYDVKLLEEANRRGERVGMTEEGYFSLKAG